MAGISILAGLGAHAQEPAPADTRLARLDVETTTELAFEDVVVTARKREQRAKDVPVAETVLSGAVLDRDDAVTLNDLAQKAPTVQVSAANARQTSIALRGLGKNSANEAIQSSVGLIIDGVVLTQAGMSWSDYVDLDHIEVPRGPQGTLQGKNTTLGVIVVSTKAPHLTRRSRSGTVRVAPTMSERRRPGRWSTGCWRTGPPITSGRAMARSKTSTRRWVGLGRGRTEAVLGSSSCSRRSRI
ncbi:MAG: TonB-dependent receptor plug domain-containing protein [Pseudomonadota bacterium]|nr:TonB-dependent receptor plug domain-containing protein [Pseudomonadota bacterium]